MLDEEVRDFNAGGALVTAHIHTVCNVILYCFSDLDNARNEFLCHGPTQLSHVSPPHGM
ncbi:hypothetical protein BDR04DRAFT_1098877 [Suillus decipiens]|nr:hypothetical protein BDR04DRAFT_1098877 [Suillus decipiens]